ncbi:M12 family metallo-peptidase [Nocardioides sp. 503]|uniref:M12 family metallo-peptidase n=1 Tax=Nocardioides sp. 503 TaxID=2508326 RepID=UPI00106F560D|nr:M12 family metallo-peptidase [Nocardioides sp. 503]
MSRSRRLVAAVAVVLAAGMLPALDASAGAAPDRPTMYRSLPGFAPTGDRVRIAPDKYAAVRVDLGQVRAALAQAPAAGAEGRVVFRVPTPSGTLERFAVQRTQVMESKLAAAHPELETFAGSSLDRPSTSIALDVTPMGLHAAVRGPQGQRAWYVDPAYDRRGTTEHLSYYGGSVPRMEEQVAEREAPAVRQALRKGSARTAPGGVVTQKVYRLALTSDPSYAAYFGTDNVLAEKVTLINRVNQIYNDDLAINLRLVNQTDRLNLDTTAEATGPDGPCGAHPCFDPADAGGPGPQDDVDSQLDYCDVPGLGRNRTVLGQLIGASNYDIGHLALGVNGGGVAYLGVVGWDFKGGGCTGLPQPKGDFFAIDYVAHEMGHQFAGNHTFNGVQGSCAGGNRNGGTSVEPGSGSSVMAYAGICLQDDLQPHTDPYFAGKTLDEVTAYTEGVVPPVVEVQTVSLRDFADNGDSVDLTFGASSVTLTRGANYNAAGIETAVEGLVGQDVTIAGWGYDPFNTPTNDIAPLTLPDDTGFQVIFAPTADPEAPGTHVDVAPLSIGATTGGASGFVGETAKGGAPDNGGVSTTTTRNHAPVVRAPANRTIPVRTPFQLKGSARDRDGQKLVYLWEQMDIGAEDTQTTDGGTALVSNRKLNGPLFRVFGTAAAVSDAGTLESPSPGINLAGTNGTRMFPDLSQILQGNTNAKTGRCPAVAPLPDDLDDYTPVPSKVRACYSEFLPTRGYVGTAGSPKPAMHFRLTARDTFPNGGGVAYDGVTLRLDPSAGPFLVTSQRAKNVILKRGSVHRVTWKVNGTRKLAKRVRILLSVDGGRTWRYTLRSATPNDGRETVRIPRRKSKNARIMIAANGNYFFDLNDGRIRIR